MSEYDFNDDGSSYEADDRHKTINSDEDTEDASETDQVKKEQEVIEMKEQIYRDKLANLKEQLRQLQERVHPEYLERLKKLEEQFEKENDLTSAYQKVALERVEREYEIEKEAAHQEFEEKRVALKEHLINELEEKKKLIEAERNTMDLTSEDNLLQMTELPIMSKLINEDKSSLHVADLKLIRRLVLEDLMDTKPVQTRRLRRRANDPAPAPAQKRKNGPSQINYMLDEKEIQEDLDLIMAGVSTSKIDDEQSSQQSEETAFEAKVEDGKLHYNKKWFYRGQHVYYEGQDIGSNNSGLILSINSFEICIKKNRYSKVRITIPQLQSGAFMLRKRAA